MKHRIHVTLRRKSQPVFTSHEFKTEDYDDLYDLQGAVNEWIAQELYEDEGYDNEDD